ncbi:hypothetical protein ACIPPJ_23805 [Streptomyces sp. NPDC086091]|uniref:hypothetical protein n=1 Tax=Streptomyces sp. NPDC086091 TaxID=3365751 RepID=UPI00380BC8E5
MDLVGVLDGAGSLVGHLPAQPEVPARGDAQAPRQQVGEQPVRYGRLVVGVRGEGARGGGRGLRRPDGGDGGAAEVQHRAP